MLTRRHHNIFVYYRGPSSQKVSETDAHRQLEDNATKALVNVLEHAETEVARSFAARFVPSVASGWAEGRRADYYLQGGPPEVPTGVRSLLGISIDGALDPKAVPAAPEAGTRIDAAIAPPNDGLIAIETKVVELLDGHQLHRHQQRWEIAPEDVHLTRWVDIWSWARETESAAADPLSRFLLDQFHQYLELLGFGRWAGFRPEDFAQFSQWSWDQQPVLRARMRGAWERVLELMPAQDAAWLGAVEAGRLPAGSTHAWAQTNRGQDGTNLTLELGADELQFNLVGWNAEQAARLESWLVEHSESVPALHLFVYERRAKADHKGSPFWMHAGHDIVHTFTTNAIKAGAFGAWLDAWRRQADPSWTRLAYHLRHSWARDEVLERGEALAQDVADLATQTVPLLRQINRWTHPLHVGHDP